MTILRANSSAELLAACLIVALTGCGHPKQAQVVPPAPPPETAVSADSGAAPPPASDSSVGHSSALKIPIHATPLATETGLASWYGPPYHNRRGSNGEIYNMNAMTAAHRTLPLGSIVRVTNVKTGDSALVRITDRGPFVRGRVIDLSLAAARKLDVWKPGVAEVKVEVMQAPVPIDRGGKWAVQIGGFPEESAAQEIADRLTRRYSTAKVSHFASPAGDWWIRVRVVADDRERARKLVAETTTPEGAVFLVRLD